MNFRNQVDIDYDVPVQVDSGNILTIDVAEDDIFSNYIEYNNVLNYSELLKVDNENVHLGYPELRIVNKADSSDFNVILYKSSNGLFHKEAIHKAEQIQYDISTADNNLVLAPYFTIKRKERLRNQRVIIEIQVPIGKKVKFGKNIDRILIEVEDDYYRYNQIFANTTWTVSAEGFRCTECKEERRKYDNFE
jgi:hypothetical protein